MVKQKFDTPEAFILGQKYNPLNRKAKKAQELVAKGAKILVPYKGISVLVHNGPEETVTTTISGSTFFPTIDIKTESSNKI